MFELNNDRCALLDSLKEGQEVEVDFQLKGRKWVNQQGETKYFNTLGAFKISPAKGASGNAASAKSQQRQALKPPVKGNETFIPDGEEKLDDLPF